LVSPDQIAERCLQALVKRNGLRLTREVCRLFDGSGDGLPWLYIDRYGPLVLAHLLPAQGGAGPVKAVRAALSKLGGVLAQTWGTESLYLRVHPSDAREHRAQEVSLIWGQPQEELMVTEGPCRFIVRPGKSVHAGLYADTRNLRAYLQTHSAGMRVLNLFCFTGSLGISAAVGAAAEIAQIDSSPAALEWAKQNWLLNQADWTCVMRFICDDCRHFLDREVARVEAGGKRTAIAIIDPPSYGRGRKRTFSLKRDVGELVEKAMRIIEPNGEIILTSNTRELTPQRLANAAQDAAQALSWSIGLLETLLPPAEDFCAEGCNSIAMRGVRVVGAGEPSEALRNHVR
jgi:23S rRNA G2069 N7-methylase RlmK/C1962 C5-methylase RlmI